MSDADEELLEGEGAAGEASSSSSEDGGRSGLARPHPFKRAASASSAVDEKVEDWVRSSRHRMLADASMNSSPDLCRALVVYKPLTPPLGPSVPPAAAAAAEESGEEDTDESGEGGGDPTPSPQTGGDDGGKTAPSAAGRGLGAINPNPGGRRSTFTEQSAGSSTAEAAVAGAFVGGKARARTKTRAGFANGFTNSFANSKHHAVGLCTAQSGGDDAGGGTMLFAREDSGQMRDDGDVGRCGGSSASVSASASALASTDADADAMDLDAAGDDGVGAGVATVGSATWEMPPPLPPASAPALTRSGTSRGAPTPDLTPERVAWARVR